MAYTTNSDKMLEAVLLDPDLMAFGHYGAGEIPTLYQGIDSDNTVISTVARIVKGVADGATEREIYKEITEHLKRNV